MLCTIRTLLYRLLASRAMAHPQHPRGVSHHVARRSSNPRCCLYAEIQAATCSSVATTTAAITGCNVTNHKESVSLFRGFQRRPRPP